MDGHGKRNQPSWKKVQLLAAPRNFQKHLQPHINNKVNFLKKIDMSPLQYMRARHGCCSLCAPGGRQPHNTNWLEAERLEDFVLAEI
jgi:hypothetical protein